MKKPIQEYKGKQVITRYDPKICIHAAECVRRLPTVHPHTNFGSVDLLE